MKPRYRLHLDGSWERVIPINAPLVAYYRDGERIPVSAPDVAPSPLVGDGVAGEDALLGRSPLELPPGSFGASAGFSGMPERPDFLARSDGAFLARVLALPASMSDGAQIA